MSGDRQRKYGHRKYTYVPGGGERGTHTWQCVGAAGGVHFSATFYKDGEEPACGLELHSRKPQGNDAPSQTNCWLIGGPCWHDGTSLYARETLWPQISAFLRAQDHEQVFDLLAYEAEKRLEGDQDD